VSARALSAEQIGGKPLGEPQKRKVVQIAGAITAVGVVLGGIGAMVDHHRFAISYLVGFAWVVTVALGALFFVLIQHLTKAGWSVAARRPMEWLSSALPVCALLFLPVVAFSHDIYHHWMSHEAAADPILKGKLGYLNANFFYARAAVYFIVWSALALYFTRTSRAQDKSGDPKLTAAMQVRSAPSVLLFGVTISFAGFDWLMSISPHWYSTIYGVYVFSGAATSSLAALALITIQLQKAGVLGRVSTVEHLHDIGKLLFGFVVFWAYIAFSQYFLIWYANIPEETIYFRMRWLGDWKVASLVLVFGHFVVPFLALLGRGGKRNPKVLGAVAVLILVMHYVDLYWLVVPNFTEHAMPSWVDVAGLLGPLGIGALAVALVAQRSAAYPLRDPRLPETMRCENL
jgi:hypothetical protein